MHGELIVKPNPATQACVLFARLLQELMQVVGVSDYLEPRQGIRNAEQDELSSLR